MERPSLPNSCWKEDIVSPGGKGKMAERRDKRLNSREKGQRGERDFIEFVCKMAGREKCGGDKRNNQWVIGGGTSNPDVQFSFLERLFHEVKNRKDLAVPEWLDQLTKDCPVNKVPVLAVKLPPEIRQCKAQKFWVFFPKSKLQIFCEEWAAVLAVPAGDIDPFPIEMDGQNFRFTSYLKNDHRPGQYVLRGDWLGLDLQDLPALLTYWGGNHG